jgi:exodeoxyribonuclease VII small subunit
MAETPADIATLTFEKALAELEQIVRSLEGGNVPLEESISIYARGEALKSHCDKLLRVAEAKVDKIRLDAGGKPAGTEALPES